MSRRRKKTPWMSDKEIKEMLHKEPVPNLPLNLEEDKTERGTGSPANSAHYTEAEVEFMMAVDAWKRQHQKPNPTWSEILAVLRSLGYSKMEKKKDE